MRYCVVTPYYREDRSLIERCIGSVRNQTIATEQILVADGFPQDWVDGAGVRHLRLDRAHADYGNVARSLGALLAAADTYDVIMFLDADNWLDPDHLATCLDTAANAGKPVDLVFARRRFARPDGSILPAIPAELPFAEHVDTNCFVFFPAAYHMIHRWCLLPQPLAFAGDTLFYHMIRNEGLAYAVTDKATVNYLCMFRSVYEQFNEVPPPDAKASNMQTDVHSWLRAVPPERRRVLQRLTGLQLFIPDGAAPSISVARPAA